ncbi:copper oxidase, partial [Streptomyces sp. SID7958]
VPVVLGGGPAAVRTATAGLERAWPARLTVTNTALLLCVLPVPSMVRVVCSSLLLLVLLHFLALLVHTVARALRTRRTGPTAGQDAGPTAGPTAGQAA